MEVVSVSVDFDEMWYWRFALKVVS